MYSYSSSGSSLHGTELHTIKHLRRSAFYRVFAVIYLCSILTLLYHHAHEILNSTSFTYFSIHTSMLISDVILAFMWLTTQSFRMCPIHREEYPENLENHLKENGHFPCIDVFICTADPYKEPPMNVVNTALSIMAYEYPTENISVYVSDDGGSQITLFAFMEAAKFAKHWLPFCSKNNVVDRNPQVYFKSIHSWCTETKDIKTMYESMKIKVEHVLETGYVGKEYITGDQERDAFSKWAIEGFTRQDHPTIIQLLLESGRDKDITGHAMGNLIYLSREKSKNSTHHFKAGALNVLLRVSATMSNAPIILTLDCDFYSNDPKTPFRALCYLLDPALESKLAYVQFPQRFQGLNKDDIYAGEFKRLFHIDPIGYDGLRGPNYVGTGCFFNRRALFGPPAYLVPLEIPELSPNYCVDKPIGSQSVLALAHRVAGCNYENQTNWGTKIGLRYGSLVEDYYTGYRLQCEGWKALFCNPVRSAFFGDAPITLVDILNQTKRWVIGLLEVALSKYCPLIFGTRSMGILMGLAYGHLAWWGIWSIPCTVYAFLPQITLLNGIYIFPKVSEVWFILYAFLFVGAYAQDLLDFVLEGGRLQNWWNHQRMWMIRGITCYLFGFVEYLLKSLGISASGFNVTNKLIDGEQSKRYDQGSFEFGVPSPMFVPLSVAAIVNLSAFAWGIMKLLRGGSLESLFLHIFLAGFIVLNCMPIYEAMALRTDKGRMPRKVTILAGSLSLGLYLTAGLLFKS